MSFHPASGRSGQSEESRAVNVRVTLGSTVASGVTRAQVLQGIQRIANISVVANSIETLIPVVVEYKAGQLFLLSDRVEGIAQPNAISFASFVFDNTGSDNLVSAPYPCAPKRSMLMLVTDVPTVCRQPAQLAAVCSPSNRAECSLH